jgi:hypothetical protein
MRKDTEKEKAQEMDVEILQEMVKAVIRYCTVKNIRGNNMPQI